MFKEAYKRDNEYITPRPEMLTALAVQMKKEREKGKVHKRDSNKHRVIGAALAAAILAVSVAAAPFMDLGERFNRFFYSFSGKISKEEGFLNSRQREVVSQNAVVINKSITIRDAVFKVESIAVSENALYMIYSITMPKDGDSVLWKTVTDFRTYGGGLEQENILGSMTTNSLHDEENPYKVTYYRSYAPFYSIKDELFKEDTLTLVMTDQGDYQAAPVNLFEIYKTYGIDLDKGEVKTKQSKSQLNELPESSLELPIEGLSHPMSLNAIGVRDGRLIIRTEASAGYQEPQIALRNKVTGKVYLRTEDESFAARSDERMLYNNSVFIIDDIKNLKNLELVMAREHKLTLPLNRGSSQDAYKIDKVKEKIFLYGLEMKLWDITVTPFAVSLKSNLNIHLASYLSLRLKDGSLYHGAGGAYCSNGTSQQYMNFEKPVPMEMIDALVIKTDKGTTEIPIRLKK